MEFKQLIDAYRQRMDAYYKEIEHTCASHINGQKKKIPSSPNYLTEVIIPVFQVVWKQICRTTKLKIPIQKPIFR